MVLQRGGTFARLFGGFARLAFASDPMGHPTRAMACWMLNWLGLTFGECFVVVLLTIFIVSAGYWPKVGAWLAEQFAMRKKEITPKDVDK